MFDFQIINDFVSPPILTYLSFSSSFIHIVCPVHSNQISAYLPHISSHTIAFVIIFMFFCFVYGIHILWMISAWEMIRLHCAVGFIFSDVGNFHLLRLVVLFLLLDKRRFNWNNPRTDVFSVDWINRKKNPFFPCPYLLKIIQHNFRMVL